MEQQQSQRKGPKPAFQYDDRGYPLWSNSDDPAHYENKEPIRKELLVDTTAFLIAGGSITPCKPNKPWKQVPPTIRSALKVPEKTGKSKMAKKIKVKTAPKKKPAKKANPDIVTLKQLCEESGVDSYKARKELRATDKIKKPGKQWHWEKSDTKNLKAIRAFLKSIA